MSYLTMWKNMISWLLVLLIEMHQFAWILPLCINWLMMRIFHQMVSQVKEVHLKWSIGFPQQRIGKREMAQEASTSKQNPPLEHFQNKKFSLSSLMFYLQISLKFFFSHLFHLSHWRGIPNSSLCIFSNLFPWNFAIHSKLKWPRNQ